MLSNGFHDIPTGKIAMVVTHLEMTNRAAIRDLPLKEGITFRQVDPDPAWYRDIFDRVGQDWLWYSRRQLSDAALLEMISDKDVALYTLTVDGRDEALLELNFREAGACELAYFGLTSKLVGSGSGRFLMDRAITLAWDRDITRFHLHTCSIDSRQALQFYLRSGFTPYRLQVEIEDDPRLNGLIPEDAAPHVPLLR